jgi:hypothetical protein
MKLTNVLAVAVLSTVTSLSAFAQAPAVKDGSNQSRALLPVSRSADFVQVSRVATDGTLLSQPILIASHIGGPVTTQTVAAIARRDRVAPVSPAVR